MNKISCKLTVNDANSSIYIEGLQDEKTIINYSGDINFTPLVSILTQKIDTETEIDLKHGNLDLIDAKPKLVVDTLVSIIESYNESIKSETIANTSL